MVPAYAAIIFSDPPTSATSSSPPRGFPQRVALERAHLVEVHDVRAVHPREPALVETRLEAAQREIEHVTGGPVVCDHVVAVGL